MEETQLHGSEGILAIALQHQHLHISTTDLELAYIQAHPTSNDHDVQMPRGNSTSAVTETSTAQLTTATCGTCNLTQFTQMR